MEDEIKTKCHICSYEWVVKSKMMFVSCPSCRAKTKRVKDETQN